MRRTRVNTIAAPNHTLMSRNIAVTNTVTGYSFFILQERYMQNRIRNKNLVHEL